MSTKNKWLLLSLLISFPICTVVAHSITEIWNPLEQPVWVDLATAPIDMVVLFLMWWVVVKRRWV